MDVVEQDRELECALDAWKVWMRSGTLARGFPRRVPGIRYRASTDFDDLAVECDVKLARSVDAAVDDLPARLRMALSTRLLGSRWTGDRDELPQAIQDAKQAVGEALRRRGVL